MTRHYAVPASFYACRKPKALPPVLLPKPFTTHQLENER